MVRRMERFSPALARMAFRLAIVVVFAWLWPGHAAAQTAGVLCLCLGAGVLVIAWNTGERATITALNRWHEGLFLICLGVTLIALFGA